MGIPACLASLNTGVQPVLTIGATMMTSTFWAMKLRIALIWLSCFCWASENLRSIPRLAASDLIESVLAVRQPDSAPVWAKPATIGFLAVGPEAELAPEGWVALVEEVEELVSQPIKRVRATASRQVIRMGFMLEVSSISKSKMG